MNIDLNSLKPSSQNPREKKEGSLMTNVLAFMNRDIKLFGKGMGAKEKESLYTELGVLIKAGLDLNNALALMMESKRKKILTKALYQLKSDLVNGSNLSEAMANTGLFSEYEVYSVKIAEESGKLPPILSELSLFYKRVMQYRRMLVSALSYPVLVVCVSLGALGFLLNFLIPIFGDLYGRLDKDLPKLTLAVIEFSNAVNAYFSYSLVLLFVVGLFFFWQRKETWFRKLVAFVLTKPPIFGPIIHKIYLSRFCQAMAFLINSSVPTITAMALTQKMINFYPIEQALVFAQEEVRKGETLYGSLSRFGVFPLQLTTLLKVGEESGQLGVMFKKLANQYSDSLEQQTKLIGSLIEPVLIIFLAIVVGVILIAMYLPIFNLVSNLGG